MKLSISQKNSVFLVFLLVEAGMLSGILPQNPVVLAVRIALVLACLAMLLWGGREASVTGGASARKTREEMSSTGPASALPVQGGAQSREPAPTAPSAPVGKDLACLYHEIRNCTSTLMGNAVLLRQNLRTEAERAPVERIERVASSIERIAREVMVLADPALVEPIQEVRLDALIRECMVDYFPGTPDVFSMICPARLPAMEGDPNKLRQAFVNLFRNSLEADATRIKVLVTRRPGSVGIQVEDDGIGCPPEELERIFLPLQSTKRDKGGMGLGLAMVKAVVETHGGTLRADSAPRTSEKAGYMVMQLTFPLPANIVRQDLVSGRSLVPA